MKRYHQMRLSKAALPHRGNDDLDNLLLLRRLIVKVNNFLTYYYILIFLLTLQVFIGIIFSVRKYENVFQMPRGVIFMALNEHKMALKLQAVRAIVVQLSGLRRVFDSCSYRI